MNRLFPLPIYTFFKISSKYGGVTFKGLKNLFPWLLKTMVFEPFRWMELALYNKKIKNHKMEKDPIFVLGFYRSGTTYTHQLMRKDDRLGYHTNFQMIFPEIMLGSERFLSPFFDFICRFFNLQDPIHRKQMSFKDPGEEDGAMTTSLNIKGSQWGYFFPKKMIEHFRKYVLFEDLTESEIEEWKSEMKVIHKKISIANKGKRLVLKSPPNTARIKLLLSMYPNAKFIFIHRDPYTVYASNQRFWKVTSKIYALGENKLVDVNAIILDTYSEIMKKYLLEKHLIPKGQLIEIPYKELVEKPLETTRKMYKILGLEDFSYIEEKLKTYIQSQKSFVQLKHELPDEERDSVTKACAPYIEHWQYPLS
jgi:hypothetical protein